MASIDTVKVAAISNVIKTLTDNAMKNQNFRLTIDGIFHIEGRGVVATGTVESGEVHVGDKVYISGQGRSLYATVTGIEMFRKLLDQAEEGDNCGVLLRGVTEDELEEGMIMSSNSVSSNTDTLGHSKSKTTGTSTTSSSSSTSTSNHSNKYNSKTSMFTDKKKIEYVIGIDLGHGETSAAICPMQWDKPVSQISLQDDKDVELGGNQKVIPSVIAFKANGGVLLGETAVESENVDNIYVGFKTCPTDIDGEAEKIMIAFMKNVYLLIRNKMGGELTDSNHLVYIACPSGWDKSAQALYFLMAQKAGIPVGGIIPESRGAFIKALEESQGTIKRNMEKGAVVVDMGSSTLDFTYLSHSGDKWYHCDFGYDCGASKVEKILMQSYEQTEEDLQRFREVYPDRIDRLTYEFRKHKEGIFNKAGESYFKKIDLEEICGDEEYGAIKVRHSEESLTSLLIKDGYVEELRKAMIDFKDTHISDKPINGVLLTGGASRMNIIKNLVMECWGVPESKISRDPDPSLTISRGVAMSARKDFRTEDETTGLEPLFRSVTGAGVYNKFVELFGNFLFENVAENVQNQCIKWRDANSNLSLNQLNNRIKNGVKAEVAECSKQVNEYIRIAIEEETKELRKKVDAIVAAYTAQGANIQLPSLTNLEVMKGGSGVDMSGVLKDISSSIETESSNWGGMIAGAGIGAAVAMILGGPLAWIIGGGALIGKWLFGEEESEAQKRQKAMSKDLSSDERAAVCSTLSEKWDEITSSIHNSIFSSLRNNKKAKQDISTAVNQLMAAYKDAITKSRIMVD